MPRVKKETTTKSLDAPKIEILPKFRAEFRDGGFEIIEAENIFEAAAYFRRRAGRTFLIPVIIMHLAA